MSEPVRLPAHLEISSIIRLVESKGGMAAVLSKGERDAGTILLVTMHRGEMATLWERLPQLDGSRSFVRTKSQEPDKIREFDEYLARRSAQDPDIWVLEVDIADTEHLVDLLPR
ncbi:DUF1491 family protein [Erythrobacter sp. MTPC3]|uniref:DUF1491 family protein n=1 Tax=Erythrobacter sp. MTPC3 TaxID=3056564 RepID=UPI0036F302F1